ncbi:MAG: CDP-archaeol synthase [Gammaproteobacteria bacterium]|nr:CDP-archaeol synthase [Gammaproteobacteria bacterium]
MGISARTATAVPLAVAIIAGVLLLPSGAFTGIVGAAVTLAAWEWSALAGIVALTRRCLYVAALIGAGAAVCLAPALQATTHVMAGAAGFWIAALLMIVATQRRRFAFDQWPRLRALSGALVLLPAWLGLVQLHAGAGGTHEVIFLLLLVWSADTAAFYAGRKWGRHRLCPEVSPGKSWEGAVAGLVAGVVLAAVYAALRNASGRAMVIFVLLAAFTVAASIVGDLFESMIKRSANRKDSGTLLPGHGGMLDRMDSLTAAVPVYLLGLPLAGRVS